MIHGPGLQRVPTEHLTIHAEQRTVSRLDEVLDPGAHRKDNAGRLAHTAIRTDPNHTIGRFQREHTLVTANLSAETLRDTELRVDAPLGTDKPGTGLVVGGLIAIQPELWKAHGHICRGQ